MNKPLILVEYEMKMAITNLVDEYSEKIPMSLIASALYKAHNNCEEMANQQLMNAKLHYEESLAMEEISKEEVSDLNVQEELKDVNEDILS